MNGDHNLAVLWVECMSSSEPAWPRFYFLNMLCVSSGCASFPQARWSSDLGGVSPHMLMGSRRSVAKHGRRCCSRTSETCCDHLATAIKENKAKQATAPTTTPPPRNQWGSLLFMPKLIRWWRFGFGRYRSRSSINALTQFYPRERVKYRISLLSPSQVGLWFGNVIVNYFTCHINHIGGGGGG